MSERWFTARGALRASRDEEFSDLVIDIEKTLRRLEGRVSYRDLYEIGRLAANCAVAEMVREHVNRG